MIDFLYKPWTVGKIEGSSIQDLTKRGKELVNIIELMNTEKEFILHVLKEKDK